MNSLYLSYIFVLIGEDTALEFPDGETPPDALNLVESSGKENEEKSKSPVRFIKSSDGTIKISSVSHTSRYVDFAVGLSVVKILFEQLLIADRSVFQPLRTFQVLHLHFVDRSKA